MLGTCSSKADRSRPASPKSVQRRRDAAGAGAPNRGSSLKNKEPHYDEQSYSRISRQLIGPSDVRYKDGRTILHPDQWQCSIQSHRERFGTLKKPHLNNHC